MERWFHFSRRFWGWLLVVLLFLFIVFIVLFFVQKTPVTRGEETQSEVHTQDIVAHQVRLYECIAEFNLVETRKKELAADALGINGGLIDALTQLQRGLLEEMKWRVRNIPANHIPSDVQIFLGGQ